MFLKLYAMIQIIQDMLDIVRSKLSDRSRNLEAKIISCGIRT